MAKSIAQAKSYAFALMIIRLYKELIAEREFVLSKQLLRSGTGVGANVEEALAGQSSRDFLSKMAIASKEAREARYWLCLMRDSKMTNVNLTAAINESDELVRLLTAIVKTTKERLPKTENSKLKTQN